MRRPHSALQARTRLYGHKAQAAWAWAAENTPDRQRADAAPHVGRDRTSAKPHAHTDTPHTTTPDVTPAASRGPEAVILAAASGVGAKDTKRKRHRANGEP